MPKLETMLGLTEDIKKDPLDKHLEDALSSLDLDNNQKSEEKKVKTENVKKIKNEKEKTSKSDVHVGSEKELVEATTEPKIDSKPKIEKSIIKKEESKPKKEVITKIKEVGDISEVLAKSMGLPENYLDLYKVLPKKAKQKFDNIVNWFASGDKLSVYTEICLEYAIKKNEATSADLRINMMSYSKRPYPTGTASSQAGQIMALFPTMGICELKDKAIVLKSDSPIVKKFKKEKL